MLSEITRHRRTNTTLNTYTNLRQSNSEKEGVEWWLPGAGVREKWGGISQRVPSLSYMDE